MEEKKLNEQESLELITQMINQTKKETVVASGDTYLVWGYLCTFISLAVFAFAFVSKDGRWGWLYFAIPLVGFILSGIVARYISKKYRGPKTYQAQSISSIWGGLATLRMVLSQADASCLLRWKEAEVSSHQSRPG